MGSLPIQSVYYLSVSGATKTNQPTYLPTSVYFSVFEDTPTKVSVKCENAWYIQGEKTRSQ